MVNSKTDKPKDVKDVKEDVKEGSKKKKPLPPDATSDNAPQDILVEDPVCHLLVPKHQALRLRVDGATYYFCSEQCCDHFAAKSVQGEL